MKISNKCETCRYCEGEYCRFHDKFIEDLKRCRRNLELLSKTDRDIEKFLRGKIY
jgi:hypothetical protein